MLISLVFGATTVKNVYLTFYGFDDNDNGAGQYATNVISDPVLHKVATEDLGTYDRPSTFAGDQLYRLTKPGDIIYIPGLKKYAIMEDTCRICTKDLDNLKKHRVDLFIGDNSKRQGDPLIKCQEYYTNEPFTDTIILNPPKNLPVDTSPLFANGVCRKTPGTIINGGSTSPPSGLPSNPSNPPVKPIKTNPVKVVHTASYFKSYLIKMEAMYGKIKHEQLKLEKLFKTVELE